MKSIRILTMILVVIFAVSILYSQETVENNAVSGISNDENKTGGENTAAVKDKVTDAEITAPGSKKEAEKTSGERTSVKSEKKKTAAPAVKDEPAPAVEADTSGGNFLLSINDGNFKYKRIPDIKLPERTPAMTEQNTQNMDNTSGDESNADSASGEGFFGLSKSTSDIVARGGILLLLLGIFILYKFRSRGGGRRGSSTRVMKSYRK